MNTILNESLAFEGEALEHRPGLLAAAATITVGGRSKK